MRMMRFQDCHVGGRMAGEREDAALQRAAEECLAAVEDELRALGGNLPEPESRSPVVHLHVPPKPAIEPGGKAIQPRAELVPRINRLPERALRLHG